MVERAPGADQRDNRHQKRKKSVRKIEETRVQALQSVPKKPRVWALQRMEVGAWVETRAW
jgi:hypothetical protein